MYLRLHDGSGWLIEGRDARGLLVVERLGRAMGLTRRHGPGRSLFVRVSDRPLATDRAHDPLDAGLCLRRPSLRSRVTVCGPAVTCTLNPFANDGQLTLCAIAVSLVIVRAAEEAGGLLLHGAMAARRGRAIVLAGQPGMGKTTASGRLPRPWVSRSDDSTLVVRSARGACQAHPWPTWSRFFLDRGGGCWSVEDAMPLDAVFLLQRGRSRPARRLEAPRAAVQLMRSAHECTWSLLHGKPVDAQRRIRLRQFENACRLAAEVPCFPLHLTLRSRFWEAMSKALRQPRP